MLQNVIKIIAQKTLFLNNKVAYLTIKSMRKKLVKYLLEQYQEKQSLTFSLPMNREELADFSNVSRPSMSREFCKMWDAGIIELY